MTSQINHIARPFGVQLIADPIAYTSTQIYRGSANPSELALAISAEIFNKLNIAVTVGIITLRNGMTTTHYALFVPNKTGEGVKGAAR